MHNAGLGQSGRYELQPYVLPLSEKESGRIGESKADVTVNSRIDADTATYAACGGANVSGRVTGCYIVINHAGNLLTSCVDVAANTNTRTSINIISTSTDSVVRKRRNQIYAYVS